MQPEAGGYHRHEEAGGPRASATPSGSTAGPSGPTPARSGSPRASTGRRRSSGPIGSPGPTAAGRASDARTWSSTSCTSAPSPPRGRSRRHPPAARPPRAGRHGRRDHAGRPVPGDAQLGLRRRAPLRGAGQLRRPAGLATAGRRLPRRRAWRSSWTSSTTTSAPRGTTWASSADTSTTGTRPRGAPRSTTTATAATRCAITCGQRPDVAGGVPLRRPPPGRRARHLRPRRAAHPPGDRR